MGFDFYRDLNMQWANPHLKIGGSGQAPPPANPPQGQTYATGMWIPAANGSWAWKVAATGEILPSQGVNSQLVKNINNVDEWSPSRMLTNTNTAFANDLSVEKMRQQNPFGQGTEGLGSTYSPFGLQDANSAYGGMGRPPSYGLSYASDNLVPSLEQRRMAMLSQLINGGGR